MGSSAFVFSGAGQATLTSLLIDGNTSADSREEQVSQAR